ncbi:AraC family transcriptional regulator [Yeosuana sp. MJ-SS3]|uniref:AraC family transcriptional regulator n=1 Tax=Gilvirhabdus luticola TaxID=3079858 RepID=A0ABU3U3V2_9FLAO|nr:AraC family transcriptional regulator [Yeosuana sp. MJ-SS3]MDU8885094.1 AraC family transcriptional regulator [Yeosuana sp. MJ-SS3]
MKVLPFKIPKPEQDALVYQEDMDSIFYDKLHQHEEIQISYILEGQGTLIVGDTINYFKSNDIIVIGSNLPHVFKSDERASLSSKMISLFFTKTSFGNHFFELEELNTLSKFFNRAKLGFAATSSKNSISELFLSLKTASKFERFLILLQLIKLLSYCNYISLSSFINEKKYTEVEGKRMQNVFEYTMSHFTEDITLSKISNIANMTKNAFCKYFKRRTNKTYFKFLNELRVEHASNLLLSVNDFSVAEIAYQSGFNNISNFNRLFKSIKKESPSMFRKSNFRL